MQLIYNTALNAWGYPGLTDGVEWNRGFESEVWIYSRDQNRAPMTNTATRYKLQFVHSDGDVINLFLLLSPKFLCV